MSNPEDGGSTPAQAGRSFNEQPSGAVREVFWAALRLGLTSFGGPIAHLGYFHNEYVVRRKWIDEQSYADAVAYANSLPGPTSSEVGIIVGTHRAGLVGGLAAWIGFTMPSAIILMAFGLLVNSLPNTIANASWLHGLRIAAVVIVAQAVWIMGRKLAPDLGRRAMAVGSAVIAFFVTGIAVGQFAIIVGSGAVGWLVLRKLPIQSERISIAASIPRWLSILSLVLFFGLLIAIPILQREFLAGNQYLAVFYAFYSSGALIFGGGHVILPLLNAQVVAPGWVSSSQFLAGYGLTQAMPGPLSTFSAFLGTVLNRSPNGVVGGFFALLSIFLPCFLLVYGPLPFWNDLRKRRSFQSALNGINAGVVGILLAALYNPIFVTAIISVADAGVAVILAILLVVLKRPPWNIVVLAALSGLVLGLFGIA